MSKAPFCLLVVVVLVLVSQESVLRAQLLYVDADAVGPIHDGGTWCSGYLDLQDALGVAVAGDTIRIADGTYAPDQGIGQVTGDREAAFALPDGVALVGGFAGCGAPDPDARDFTLFETVLTGDLLGDDTPDFTNRSDNSYHVVTTHDVSDATMLDGFTIRSGYADGPNLGPSVDSQDQGGGVNNYFGHPQLLNCTLIDNYATNHGAFNDHGGASLVDCVFRDNWSGNIGAALYMHFDMDTTVVGCEFHDNTTAGRGAGAYLKGNTTATFTDCLFNGNTAHQGGGMYCDGNSNPALTDCTFAGNVATGDDQSRGGGMYNDGGSSPTLAGCVFSANTSATRGGGIYNHNSSNPVVNGCTFTGNSATLGGGMYNFVGTSPVLTDCVFQANSVVGRGGAMYNTGTNPPGLTRPSMIRCTFIDNTATGPVGEGGALYNSVNATPDLTDCSFLGNEARIVGGAMATYAASEDPPFVLTNCVFLGNTSLIGRGGAMHCAIGGVYRFTNCVFSGNTAASWGGALTFFDSEAFVTNCSFSGNTAGDLGGAIYVGDISVPATVHLNNSILWGNTAVNSGDMESAQIHMDAGTLLVNHSCLQGWTGSLGGVGNIGDDPMFVGAIGTDGLAGTADDDLRLSAGSPAIDAGDNEVVEVVFDLDGENRVIGFNVDMGPYEFGAGLPIPAVSQWGLSVIALMIAIGASIVFRRISNAGNLRGCR